MIAKVGTPLLTVREAATLMRIGRDTAYALVAEDRISSVRLHSSVAFTMDIYSHATPLMEAEAAVTITQLVLGTRPARGGR